MHRFSACAAVAAMLFALASGPLIHVHDSDERGHAASIVHAHLPGLRHAPSSFEQGIEADDSHEHVRWIDVFTLTPPVTGGFHAVAEYSEPLTIPPLPASRVVASVLNLRTHSPPALSRLNPRSPPIF